MPFLQEFSQSPLEGAALPLQLQLGEAVGYRGLHGSNFLGSQCRSFLEPVLSALEGCLHGFLINLGITHSHVGEDIHMITLDFRETAADGEFMLLTVFVIPQLPRLERCHKIAVGRQDTHLTQGTGQDDIADFIGEGFSFRGDDFETKGQRMVE